MDATIQFSDVHSARTAIIFGDDEIDYARFRSDVADLACWLSGNGLSPGQRVGIFLRHSYWAWVAHLACMNLNLVVTTLTNKFADEIAAVGGMDVWLGDAADTTGKSLAKSALAFSPKSIRPLSEQIDLSAGGSIRSSASSGARVERLMFTSGTTGNPKGILLNEQVLNKRIDLARSSQDLGEATVLMTLLGIDTTAGFRYPLAVWNAGGSVVMRSPVPGTDRSVLSLKSLSRTSTIVTSPQRLLDTLRTFWKPWDGRDTRKFIVAGGRLPNSVRERALQIACKKISIAYGATETGSVATGDSSLLNRHPGAVGFVVEGASVQIVDENGKIEAPGEPGIVRTRTSHMANAYVGANSDTPDSPFRGGWFYPGDEGVLFADGLLAINGRLSETLNLMGWKVSIADLETKLAQPPSIRETCAIMIKFGSVDMLVIAAVSDDDAAMRGLWQQIKAQIPLGVPTRLVRVPRLPRNAMGKVARPELEKHLTKYFASRESYPTAKDSFSRDPDSSKND